jgi:spore coat polysaccharide biosynthesis protein SpsF
MPYLYDQEGRFRILLVNSAPDRGSLRWTVDTPEDLELVRKVYAAFPGRDDFTTAEIVHLFDTDPSLAEINSGVHHKTFKDVDERRS